MEKSKGTSFVVRIRTSRTAAFGLAGVMFASQLGYGFSIGFLKLPPLPRVPKTSAMVGVPTVKWEPSSEPVPWPTLATLVASVYPETLTVCDRTEAPQSLPGDNTPLQGSGAGGPMGLPNISPFGPTAGDPVNLTNGQEEYRPGADMYVYNPTGPSVVWKRSYNSMTNWDSALGMGWSHPYNIAVLPPNGGTPGQLVFANNARAAFTCTVPTNGNSPKVATWSNNGVGIYLEWHYDAGGNYFVATFKDHSSMTTVKTSTDAYLRPAKWADKLGYHVKFTYGDYTHGTDYAVRPRLTSVTDSSNVAFLTFTLDGNGNIQQAYDRYSRSVYYTVSSHAYGTGGVTPSYSYELDQASVVVPTGTGSPPARHTHTYANYNNAASQLVPYLATITVPDPDGSGTAVSTLTYDSLGRVADIEDANGYKSVFTYNSGNTQVDLEDGSSNLFYRYLVYYTGKLVTSVKDQNLDTVVSYHYGTNAPGKPDTVTREYKVSPHLARVTTLSYDTNGNLLTALLPSGLTTTYTYTTNGTWPLGRLDSVQVNNGGAALEPTTFVYNGSFQLVQVDTPVLGDSVGAGSQSSYITYTAMGNVDTVTTPGNNDTAVHTTTYGYTSDSWGSYSQSRRWGSLSLSRTL